MLTGSKLRFFRGIAVSKTDLAEVYDRLREGDLSGPADWRFWHQRHPNPLEVAMRPNLDRAMTSVADLDNEGLPASFACGDEAGAVHYAWRAATDDSKAPVLVEFELEAAKVAVDGRDALYSVVNRAHHLEVRLQIEQAWGTPIRPYIERAVSGPNDPDFRFAIVDLASIDEEVIAAHHANALPIQGRYGTRFCSAFVVPRQLPPQAVLRVWAPEAFGDGLTGKTVLDVYALSNLAQRA